MVDRGADGDWTEQAPEVRLIEDGNSTVIMELWGIGSLGQIETLYLV